MDAALADGAARGESGQCFTRRRVKQSKHQPSPDHNRLRRPLTGNDPNLEFRALSPTAHPQRFLRDVPVDDANLESTIDTRLLDYFPCRDVQHKQIVSAWLIRTIERNITYELKFVHARTKPRRGCEVPSAGMSPWLKLKALAITRTPRQEKNAHVLLYQRSPYRWR